MPCLLKSFAHQETGKRELKSVAVEKRDSVDKATEAHYLVVYAGPRRAIDGCQRRVWSRQMGLHPTFHTKDNWAGITRPWKWHVDTVILDYLSALLSFAACLRVARFTSDKITNCGSASAAVRLCLICIVKIQNVCSGSPDISSSLRSSSPVQFASEGGCVDGTGETEATWENRENVLL